MDYLLGENGFSSDGNWISSYLWRRALLDLFRRVAEETDFLPRDLRFSKEQTANSSELRNLSSELSFHSSEVSFRASVENFRLLPRAFRFPPEESRSSSFGLCVALYFYLHLHCEA